MGNEEKLAYLAKYFPVSEKISDKEKAAAVADVWLEMLRLSPWDDISQAKFTANSQRSLVNHVNATTEAALAVGRIITQYHKIDFDEDTIVILGLLHDVDKMVEFVEDENGNIIKSELKETIQHGVLSSILAYNCGFSMEMLHLILTHTPTQNMTAKYPEGILFNHIDLCDWEIVTKFGA